MDARIKLTQKQESFCIAYIECGNASEAYRSAYNAENMKPETIHVKASELMANGKITERLKQLNSKAVTDAVMTRQEALERLSGIARTDLADLVEFGAYELGSDQDGNPIIQSAWKIKDSALQDPEKMAAIAELTAGRDGVKIKTHSPLQAIQQLAKMQGWEAVTKIDHTTNGESLNAMSPAQAAIERFKKSNEPEQ